MSLSQNPSFYLYIVALIFFFIQITIWKSVSHFEAISRKDLIASFIIFTLLILPFSISYNFSIIQLLWDVFIWSHSIHPYSITPVDPLIAKAQTALLFEYLPNKFEFSTTPAPLLIGLKPLFFLYKKIGLFGTLFISKILLAVTYFFFVDYTVPSKFKLFWLFNPIIWILAISQADFSLLGFISFCFGAFYFYQSEYQNAFFIWGIASLFGFEFVLLILFITALDKKFTYLIYSILSSSIWILLIWDTNAIYTYFFESIINHSILFNLFPLLIEYNYLLIVLFYVSLITLVLISALLVRSHQAKESKHASSTYLKWLISKKRPLLVFFAVLSIIIFYQSFSLNLIWASFAALFTTQFNYLDQQTTNS